MMMDAIDDELRGERPGQKARRARCSRTPSSCYMMANQLALLDLTTLEGYPRRLGGGPTEADVAERFARRWAAIKLRSPVRSTAGGGSTWTPGATARQIVAFSDPNDILSWRLKRYDLKLPPSEWKLGQADERLFVERRIQRPAAVFRSDDRAYGILRQRDRDGHARLRERPTARSRRARKPSRAKVAWPGDHEPGREGAYAGQPSIAASLRFLLISCAFRGRLTVAQEAPCIAPSAASSP